MYVSEPAGTFLRRLERLLHIRVEQWHEMNNRARWLVTFCIGVTYRDCIAYGVQDEALALASLLGWVLQPDGSWQHVLWRP